MPEQKIIFNSNGLKVAGILARPKQPTGRIVILCHGYSTHKDNATNAQLVPLLEKAGIASFRFDFFGHGKSEGKIDELTVQKGVQNILDAVEFVQQNGFSEIGLTGSSFGGLCAVLAASKIQGLFALGLKAPLLDIRENETREFFGSFEKGDAYLAFRTIKCPILIVHGDADSQVPIEQSKKAVELNPYSQLVVLHGAEHSFSKPEHRKQLVEGIAKFLVQSAKKQE